MIYHQVLNSYSGNYNARIYHNITCDPHFHGNYELIYNFTGNVQVTVSGNACVLDPGELILIPPYTVHSLEIRDAKTWVGVFAEDFILSFDRKDLLYSKFRCAPDVEQFLRQHLFTAQTIERFLHISCLYMVCSQCVEHATVYQTNLDYTFMHDVISYITANIRQELTMNQLADAMNYEYHYFSALFHKCFSMNFKSFLNIFRFEMACSLLNEKELSASQLAEACGFGSVRNFNRVFKALSGYTPNQYRNMRRPDPPAATVQGVRLGT